MSRRRSPTPVSRASGDRRTASSSTPSSSSSRRSTAPRASSGVSREELVVALPDADARAEFAAAHGISEADLEAAIRAGVVRAIDDAENAGALSPVVASGLREVATRLPIDQLIALIDDAGAAIDGAGGLLDELGL